MAEQLTHHERIARAQAAQRLIEEVAVHIEAVGQTYHDDWEKAKTPEAREVIWHKLAALKDVIRDINGQIRDGEVAKAEMENEYGPQ